MQVPEFLNDVLFKIVFGDPKNREILRALLNAVLELEGPDQIESLEILSPTFDKENISDKGCVLDLHCRDGRGRRFNVEVQVQGQGYFQNRTFFYANFLKFCIDWPLWTSISSRSMRTRFMRIGICC